MSNLPAWIIVLSHLTLTLASPIYAPQFLSGGTGRNIRHLPCVSLRTGETGVCMFAFTCVKSNGTHLGTCIDRFYFGSCCKLEDDTDIYPQDNTIDGASAVNLFVTTDSALESNDIPDFFTRPKPISEKIPETSTLSTVGQTVLSTRQSTTSRTTTTSTTTSTTTPAPTTTTTKATTRTTTTKEPQRIVTKRPPFFSTPYTTTQPPIGLSTFQTLHDYSHGSATSTTFNDLRISTIRPLTSQNTPSTERTKITTTGSFSKPAATTLTTLRPSSNPSTTKKPTSVSSTRPSNTRKPVNTSTRPSTTSTTERTSTRFPPRNSTTTTRPIQTTNTRKPQHTTKRPTTTLTTTLSKRPTTTTKRPITGTRRPPITTSTKPLVVSATRPASITDKPTSTSVKVTQTNRPPPLTSTQETPTTFGTRPSSLSVTNSEKVKPSQRPTTKRPLTTINTEKIITTPKPTTFRPPVTSTRPRPSSKPTRTSVTSTGRPTIVKTTAKPQQSSTEKTKPSTSLESSSASTSSSSMRPSTLRPTSTASVRPRPTEKPSKPTKPSKPPRPSSTTQLSTSKISTTTEASTLSSILNDTTVANGILPTKGSTSIASTQITSPTSQPPGLVTWSSNSDDDVTKAPEISSTTSNTNNEASTEPEWSPITTPDGWIIIQSPTTDKTSIDSEDSTRPETTKIPTTTVRPSSESITTDRVEITTRPSLPTTASTIATITAATDLPVPIETLNMSDYKQVCGRRLFPESRIVGGDHSSFGKWPWQISLRQWRTSAYLHKCGAALLNENWAITAAHCVENVPPSDLLLRIGEHDLANEDEPYGFQERRVQIVASHPQFDPRTFEYDLALLRFYEPLQPFQPNLLPVCLPDDDENYVGHTAYVTGWGRLYEEGPLPSVLQEVSVPVVNNTVCEGMYRNAGYIEHIPHIFICAGWRKGGFDSCEGDSGGPMVIQRPRDKRWILAGVISWGIGCAEPNQPGVYTRISEFREWINQILQF